MLRTVTLNLKELNDYGLNLNILSNNLYNRTMYIIRQMMTGFQKENPTPNEKEILKLVKEYELKFNEYNSKPKLTKKGKIKKIKSKNGKVKKSKTKEPIHFDADHWMPSYEFLYFLLSTSKDVDYCALPSHTAQNVIKQV